MSRCVQISVLRNAHIRISRIVPRSLALRALKNAVRRALFVDFAKSGH